MDGSGRDRGARKLVCLAMACLALGVAVSPAFAQRAGSDVTIADATVVSIAQHSAENCVDTGLIRWQAVKGVDAYTVRFNDAAFGGAEQVRTVAKPFPDDQKEPLGSPINAPAGTHQLVWTGLFGSPPCGPAVDYSGRLTNARVEYVREGAFIDGTIRSPQCSGDDCPTVRGIKVTAKGEATKSDTTDASGRYSIKVKKGSYTVVPNEGKLKFDPDKMNVRVGASGSVRANFTIHLDGRHDPLAVATIQRIDARKGHAPNAEFLRDGKWRRLGPDSQLRVGDAVRTDAFTTAAFEFAIGGRVGVAENGVVKITSEGDVAGHAAKVQLSKGEMWAKCQKLKEPLEIQTGGGVIGIKG